MLRGLRAKFFRSEELLTLVPVRVSYGVLKDAPKTAQETRAERSVLNLIPDGVSIKTGFVGVLKSDNRMPTLLDLFDNLIYNSIGFQRKHQLLREVVRLAYERGIVHSEVLCAARLAGAGCHFSKVPADVINYRSYKVPLELDNLVEDFNGAVIVGSRFLRGGWIVNGFPVRFDIGHISFAPDHLTGPRKGASHDLLQGDTTLFNHGDKFVRLNIRLGHGRLDGVKRHRIWPFGKGRRRECHALH